MDDTARSGYFLVDKPAGQSSFSAVQAVRRTLGVGGRRGRKAGHAGTLDPFATGLLVVAIGSASRLLRWNVGCDKRYLVTVQLGLRSPTDDVTGECDRVTSTFPSPAAVEGAVQEVAARPEQVPSAVSAVHVDGERAYRRVRRGEEVAIPPRPVRIEARVERYDAGAGRVELDVRCSAGAYMRALARDIGEVLGVGGVAAALRRTHVGTWSVDDAAAPDEVTWAALRDPVDLVASLPLVRTAAGDDFCGGRRVPLPDGAPSAGELAVTDERGQLLGVGEARQDTIQPRVVIAPHSRGLSHNANIATETCQPGGSGR